MRHFLILSLLLSAVDATSGESQLWTDNGANWTPTSRLPYFSYSGYRYGERSIPDVPVVRTATGLVGDGVADDTAAMQRAIDATSGGALFIPQGKYKITKRLLVKRSEIVLRGAGEGRTILYMPIPIATMDGTDAEPDSGGLIQVEGEQPNGGLVGNVVQRTPRGETRIPLDRAPNVRAGQYVRIISDNSDGIARHLLNGAGNMGSDVFRIKNFIDTVAVVVAVNGNTVIIDRPLRLDLSPDWRCQVLQFAPKIQEFGIEDLTFEMLGRAKKPHRQEEGFSALELKGALHSWVRRITIIDCDNGVKLNDGTRFCTVIDVTCKANKRTTAITGHHALWVGRQGQENLLTRFDIPTQFQHDLTVAAFSHGNVFSEGRGTNLSFDHHGDAPYENLFTNLDVGIGNRIWFSGGKATRMPNSAVRSTVWNLNPLPARLPARPNWALLNIIGAGYTASTGDTVNVWVEPIAGIQPANLHAAQLARRLGGGTPVNRAPTASAGPDRTITLPATASLDGTVSDDGLPSGSLTTTWSTVSGPGTVSFAESGAVDTTAAFSAAGTYVLRLLASDGTRSASDEMTVTVSPAVTPVNRAPTVSAGPDRAIILPAAASLDGTVSDDGQPTGSMVTVAWSKVSGPGTVVFAAAGKASTTVSCSVAGTYVLRLSASDGALSSSDEVTVTVAAAPATFSPMRINFQPPTAPVPDGWLHDNGKTYAARQGQIYGWSVDLSAPTFLRNRNHGDSPDQVHDTHLLVGTAGQSAATWELAVPNGLYLVTILMGDPSDRYMPDTYHCTVEGSPAVNATVTAADNWVSEAVIVKVRDGRLSVAFAGGSTVTNKLCAVQVETAPASSN